MTTVDGSVSLATMVRVQVEDLESGEPIGELNDLLQGIEFVLEYCALAASFTDSSAVEDIEFDEVSKSLRVVSLNYGSPLEIFIDLEPLLKVVSENGYLVFASAITLLFGGLAKGWESLENALSAQYERREAKRKNREARANPAHYGIPELAATDEEAQVNADSLAREKSLTFVRELNDRLRDLDEYGKASFDETAATILLDHHPQAIKAIKLRTHEVTVEFQ